MSSSPTDLASRARQEWQRSRERLGIGTITDTDLANGKRLAIRHGADIRFTPENGWLVWDGNRWLIDEKQVMVQALAKETAASIYDEVRDSADRNLTFTHARRSQSKAAIESMIFMARSEPGVATRLTEFDKDGWLLNVPNGTVNLRTGALQPHRREDHITHIAGASYDEKADCRLWDAFLWRVTDQNPELHDYLRRFVGYMLVGDTTEQALHFLHGMGGNGKSVFCEVLLELLGEYAVTASPDLIMQKRHGGIPNDVARLRGVRVAVMNETSQGARFDEAKLKDLTGGDKLSARFLHREYFDFRPTHRLLIRGNHKPVISGTDEGIWRRLRLVPFTVTIPDNERDNQLLTKLRVEMPGILNWAIRGCLEWQQGGLRPPAIVTDAVRAYREESDTLGRFIAERCEVSKLAQVKSSDFFRRYQQYAEQAGERWISLRELPNEMQRRGFTWKRTNTGAVYTGIVLRPTESDGR